MLIHRETLQVRKVFNPPEYWYRRVIRNVKLILLIAILFKKNPSLMVPILSASQIIPFSSTFQKSSIKIWMSFSIPVKNRPFDTQIMEA